MAVFRAEQEKGPPKSLVIAAADDNTIRVAMGDKKTHRYEANCSFSQIVVTHGLRAVIAATSAENKPGALHVLHYDQFAKYHET
jgi:hypothetical protein